MICRSYTCLGTTLAPALYPEHTIPAEAKLQLDLVGVTGWGQRVGKTEVTRALAQELFGSAEMMTPTTSRSGRTLFDHNLAVH